MMNDFIETCGFIRTCGRLDVEIFPPGEMVANQMINSHQMGIGQFLVNTECVVNFLHGMF